MSCVHVGNEAAQSLSPSVLMESSWYKASIIDFLILCVPDMAEVICVALFEHLLREADCPCMALIPFARK